MRIHSYSMPFQMATAIHCRRRVGKARLELQLVITGQIPGIFQSLNFDYMFLNNNLLSGAVPDWINKQ
ncbi:hypothetical protein RHGRI_018605 [Rhododendron griersonianum]|uniref:Uncharacterized protein n=1 Tax=Rhododendron griersonianum TaxID=479676 RepID=A0AAV6K258_9ERIC|nr:hypothetical protein RHGRI_018605 [Rhododendron griersonianum]